MEDQQEFDTIVLGEVRPRVWMAGSHLHQRTETAQDQWPTEDAAPGTMVQVAVTWQGNRITLYRNGRAFATYERPSREYDDGMRVMMGVRHCHAAGVLPTGPFAGAIEEAQIYAEALNAEQIGLLRPDGETPVKPLARWTFEDGTPRDEMGFFGPAVLRNGAVIRDGQLHLDGQDDYLITPAKLRAHANLSDHARSAVGGAGERSGSPCSASRSPASGRRPVSSRVPFRAAGRGDERSERTVLLAGSLSPVLPVGVSGRRTVALGSRLQQRSDELARSAGGPASGHGGELLQREHVGRAATRHRPVPRHSQRQLHRHRE